MPTVLYFDVFRLYLLHFVSHAHFALVSLHLQIYGKPFCGLISFVLLAIVSMQVQTVMTSYNVPRNVQGAW